MVQPRSILPPQTALTPLAARLRRFFRAYEADAADAARFRARQIKAVLQLTPVAMGINLLNALVLSATLWSQVHHGVLVAWSSLVFAIAVLGLRGWITATAQPERFTASERAMRRGTVQAAALGATWGVLPAITFAGLDPPAQFYVGMVSCGMICAGGFALSSMPKAATAYVLALGLGAAWALAGSGLDQAYGVSVLLLAYCAIVVYSVWTYARIFGATLVAEAFAARQSEVISLLLKDFEDHTSDLLWELDAAGRFAHVSPRLAHVLGVDAERLARMRASTLLRRWVPDDEAAASQWATLRARLEGGRAFRDVQLSLATRRGRSWWSLSARPLVGDDGRAAGWRGVGTDVTDAQVAHRKLSWLASNDSLTGLVNRHQFHELLHALLQDPASAASPMAVVCFDLDGFKQINDRRGHAVGDQVLAAFGQRLLDLSRRNDTVARLGGDEFAMLVRGAAPVQAARALIDRLLAALDAPCEVGGRLESVRTSIGVAVVPEDGQDVDTLLNHADLALYAAKHAGGSRYCFFHADLAEVNRRRTSLANDLRGAIDRGEFWLEYQPQIATLDHRVCGLEALLRWKHPDHGLVSPAEFIPIAEAAGLMDGIGDWVLRKACEEVAQWPESVAVSINVSATQLTAPGFVERVEAAAGTAPMGRFELEVTESALIEDADAAVLALQRLRALGFKTALDDFGTGYSALGYLRRFPFDTLKIDRSFVQGMARDREAQVLVETILAMARALGMRTIAEGVEHRVEAEMLTQGGCTALQGFLISRPLRAAAVADFLRDWRGIDDLVLPA